MLSHPKHRLSLTLDPIRCCNITQLLETHVRPSLTPDVSAYARGRTRCWLEREAPLSNRQTWKPGLQIPELWEEICRIWRVVNLPENGPHTALAIYGEIGILPHRDATYASPMAMTINLGQVSWGWTPDRRSNNNDDLVWMTMTGGEVLVFDCKHRHTAMSPAPDRWAITVWSSKIPI